MTLPNAGVDTGPDAVALKVAPTIGPTVADTAASTAGDTVAAIASPSQYDCDIIIVGAGPVGLALAGDLMRRSATAGLSLIVLDARDAQASTRDPRVLAVSYGSRILLEPLGWSGEATPIEKIHVSQRGHFGRAQIDRHEHDLPALGYVVRYGAVTRALVAGFSRLAASGSNAHLKEHCTVTETLQDAEGVTVRFTVGAPIATNAVPDKSTALVAPATAGQLRARLVVHAEGAPSTVADTAKRSRDYGQTAIVGAVRCTTPIPRMAWERFTTQGPIALLPLAECVMPSSAVLSSNGASKTPQRAFDYALVWCQAPEEANRRLALSDLAFLAELGVAFGERVGRFTHIEDRARFALGLQSRTTLVDGLTAAIGNAAQTLHPVAGQGLNLGLRDAQALAAAIGQYGATAAALKQFAAHRRLDRTITIGLTDSLARGFTVDFPPLAALRGLALAALDFLPGTKSVLARQMMFGQRQ